MKKIFIIVLILIAQKTIAQDTVHLKQQETQIVYRDRTPQAVFGEILGRAGDFSLNYDRRFLKRAISKRDNGWGFCIGIGLINHWNSPDDDQDYLAVPVSVNYLAGKKGEYLELGAGFTYFNGTQKNGNGGIVNNSYSIGGNSVVGTLLIGYRIQPVNRGFMFRFGISPFILKNGIQPYYPYISFGYNF
jgi:hypothetical protein